MSRYNSFPQIGDIVVCIKDGVYRITGKNMIKGLVIEKLTEDMEKLDMYGEKSDDIHIRILEHKDPTAINSTFWVSSQFFKKIGHKYE